MKKYKMPKIGGFSSEFGVCYSDDYYYVASYYDKEDHEIKTIVKKNLEGFKHEITDMLFKDLMTPFQKFKKSVILVLLEILIVGLILLISIPLQKTLMGMGIFHLFYFVVISSLFAFFCSILWNYRKEREADIKSKYHGAEHKTFNAYEKYGDSYSIKNVKKASRFHPRCGVSLFSNFLFLYIICFVISVVFNTYMVPLFFVFEFSKYVRNIDIISYLTQKIVTTREPDVLHIQVAMTAFTRLIELENGSEIKPEEELAEKKMARYRRRHEYFEFDDDDFEMLSKFDEAVDSIARQAIVEKTIFPPGRLR